MHSEGVQALVMCSGKKRSSESWGYFEGFAAENVRDASHTLFGSES